jgi:hypothetical protein
MFRLKPDPTFWARIDIPIPGAEPATLELELRHKRRDQAVAFAQALAEREPLEALREIVVSWRGVDEPFSEPALAELVANYAGAPDRILSAYFDELRGARRKN